MKAFVLGMLAMIVITAVAWAGLSTVNMSAKDTYVERSNVRL